MIELSEQIYLSLQVFDFIRLVDTFLFINFNRYFLVIPSIDSHSYQTICAFTEFSKYFVLFQLLLTFNRDSQIEQSWFVGFLFLCFKFFLFNFIYVIGIDLIFHHRIDQLGIKPFNILFFFLQWIIFRSFVAWRCSIRCS